MKHDKIKPNPAPTGNNGYPQTDIGKKGVMVKGRWPAGTEMKKYGTMRGAGAATKGKKFLED